MLTSTTRSRTYRIPVYQEAYMCDVCLSLGLAAAMNVLLTCMSLLFPLLLNREGIERGSALLIVDSID